MFCFSLLKSYRKVFKNTYSENHSIYPHVMECHGTSAQQCPAKSCHVISCHVITSCHSIDLLYRIISWHVMSTTSQNHRRKYQVLRTKCTTPTMTNHMNCVSKTQINALCTTYQCNINHISDPQDNDYVLSTDWVLWTKYFGMYLVSSF